MSSTLFIYHKSLFLLFLSIVGNFIAETLSCGSQKVLEKNMFVKSLIIFFLIYFTMDFSDKSVVHPIVHLKRSAVVWIFILMFTKMNNFYTGITLLLLILTYIVNNFIEYYQHDETNNKEMLNRLNMINYILNRLMIVMLVIGFSLYFLKQKRDHKKFSYTKFILGVQKCGVKN